MAQADLLLTETKMNENQAEKVMISGQFTLTSLVGTSPAMSKKKENSKP
jgi:hypothetical protein